MKENFLPIPGTNYEINGKLVVRNSATKQVIRAWIRKGGRKPMIHLHRGNLPILKRTPETLRRIAVAAHVDVKTFEPIHSVGGRYEINNRGVVRNSKTKLILKLHKNAYVLWNGEKYVRRTRSDLLWEVHGVLPSKLSKRQSR